MWEDDRFHAFAKRGEDLDTTSRSFTIPRLSCEVPKPTLRGSKGRPCRICGYVIGESTKRDKNRGIVTHPSVEFVCCAKEAHQQCWLSARSNENDEIKCGNVTAFTKKDRKTLYKATLANPKTRAIKKYAVCEYCDERIDTDAAGKHLRDNCSVLKDLRDGGPGALPNDLPGSKMNEIRRLARTGLVLACSKMNVPFDLRRKAERHAGSGRAQSPVRAVSADSQVL